MRAPSFLISAKKFEKTGRGQLVQLAQLEDNSVLVNRDGRMDFLSLPIDVFQGTSHGLQAAPRKQLPGWTEVRTECKFSIR